jgi:hypothetical protein
MICLAITLLYIYNSVSKLPAENFPFIENGLIMLPLSV